MPDSMDNALRYIRIANRESRLPLSAMGNVLADAGYGFEIKASQDRVVDIRLLRQGTI